MKSLTLDRSLYTRSVSVCVCVCSFQAMGVYLYGELMVQEDPEQQALACRCLSLVQEQMDQATRKVVEEMVL